MFFFRFKQNRQKVLSLIIILLLSACSGYHKGYSRGKAKNTGVSASDTMQGPLWTKIAGIWKLNKNKGLLIEVRGYTRNRGYSHLINYNTIITKQNFSEYTDLTFKYALLKAKKNPVSEMVVFAAKDFRNFYAIRLNGSKNGLDSVSLIGSKIKNAKLPRHKKWNFTITEYDTKKCKIDFNKKYNARLTFKKKKVTLYINKKKIARFTAPENLTRGKIAFSNKNAVFALKDVKLYNGDDVIFSDNFTTDTIHRYGRKLKIKKRVIKK